MSILSQVSQVSQVPHDIQASQILAEVQYPHGVLKETWWMRKAHLQMQRTDVHRQTDYNYNQAVVSQVSQVWQLQHQVHKQHEPT